MNGSAQLALPAGWSYYEEGHYYYNESTGESSWTHPELPMAASAKPAAELPPGWAAVSSRSGRLPGPNAW